MELLHHLITNDHGELTAIITLLSDNWAYIRAWLGRFRPKA